MTDKLSITDITTVYEAFRTCNSGKLARALAQYGGLARSSGSVALQQRRIKAVLALINEMNPNLECSAGRVVVPWVAESVEGLKGRCWPDALGTRVVMPNGKSSREAYACLARIFLAMCSIE